MATVSSTEVAHALIDDRNPESGWLRYERGLVWPREVWLADATIWVRADGSRASGWRGHVHVSAHFGWLARLRIRQAVRRWAKRHPVDAAERVASGEAAAAPWQTPGDPTPTHPTGED